MIEPKGRMINRDISESEGFASLCAEAAVLFCMIIPHLNSHGKMPGGPGYVKEIVCPKIKYLTPENIPMLLLEISSKTNVKWYKHEGRFWIHSLKFLKEHQRLDRQKMGNDRLPGFDPELVFDVGVASERELIQSSPEEVVDKSTQKYKDKDKYKRSAASPQLTPSSAAPSRPSKGDHAKVVEHVLITYDSVHGHKYPFSGRDGKIVKWLIPNYGPDGACALWDEFLSRNWDWKKDGRVTKKIPHTLPNLEANIGELLESGEWKKRLLGQIPTKLHLVIGEGFKKI